MFSPVLGDDIGRIVSFNSGAFALRFLAGAAADDRSLRETRAFALVGAERVRPPRLSLFAFDSPRLICGRPMNRVGRGLNLSTPFLRAHWPESLGLPTRTLS